MCSNEAKRIDASRGICSDVTISTQYGAGDRKKKVAKSSNYVLSYASPPELDDDNLSTEVTPVLLLTTALLE